MPKMPKQKRTFMAHYTFTLNVPIDAASLEVAFRRSGRSTFDTALDQTRSVNYHHWTVEDPETGAYISSKDPDTVVMSAQVIAQATEPAAKECDA